MKIKTYEGETLQEAFRKMQQETSSYGYSSSVISTRSFVRGGIFGFFGRQVVQVTAAIDESGDAGGSRASAPAAPAAANAPAAAANGTRLNARPAGAKRNAPKNQGRSRRSTRSRRAAAPSPSPSPAAAPVYAAAGDAAASALPAPLQRLYGRLTDSEVEPDLARDIVQSIARRTSGRGRIDDDTADRLFREYLSRLINVGGPVTLRDKHLKIVAFVGPTGVGKTTTIAKLAADFIFNQKKRVALITLDTYRIAAVDQLKTYAQIMNVPVEVARDPADLRLCVNQHADADVILIDTAGRSPRDEMYISELGSLLGAIEPLETHLVLGAGTRYRDICTIIDNYGRIAIDRVVITKLDEIATYGNIVNLKDRVSVPVSYVTTGQNVPQDIEVADTTRLAGLISGMRQ